MTLQASDPQIFQLIEQEKRRQATTLELIASENHVSAAVMEAMGSPLTNKYAEGYPGARYYQGCGYYDQVETLAIDRAKQLFGCAFANVQPHSGAQANGAVFLATLNPGDTFASLVLADGGHLSHGRKVNMSGKWFNPVHYPLVYDSTRPDFEHIDYDAVRDVCLLNKPKILLCGYSAYPRTIDFKKFRDIADECGALLMADVAHIAGLIVGGAHPSPFPHAHIVTTTTHKTLRGPRGGMILTNDPELATRIDKAVFPGMQGGPLMHVIAAKAVAFGEDLQPQFKTYAQQIVKNARALVVALKELGYRIVSGGTDNHLLLVDLRARNAEFTGVEAAVALEKAGIIVNFNGIPKDPRPAKLTSGIRLGTPAVTTRGLKEQDMFTLANFIDRALLGKDNPAVLETIRNEVAAFCQAFPMPH
jgi:glycine hydroxymethyltransferase